MGKQQFVSQRGFSRRQFLTLAGGLTAGSLLAACAPAAAPTTGEEGGAAEDTAIEL